jgi:hypothetical protein
LPTEQRCHHVPQEIQSFAAAKRGVYNAWQRNIDPEVRKQITKIAAEWAEKARAKKKPLQVVK